MQKKYKLVKRKDECGNTVTRVQALRDGKNFCKGEIGGIVDSDSSLSMDDESWIDYSSKLTRSSVSGDVLLKDTRLIDSKLTYVTGSIVHSILIGMRCEHSRVSIYCSTCKTLRATASVFLNITASRLECPVETRGTITLINVRMNAGEDNKNTSILDSVTIDEMDSTAPVSIADSYLYKTSLRGMMQLSESTITNSTLRSECEDGELSLSPLIQNLHMVGSMACIPKNSRVTLTSGICISDVNCSDLSKVKVTLDGNDRIVLRVPGIKWYVQDRALTGLVSYDCDSDIAMTSEGLYRMLREAHGGKVDPALELLTVCIHMMRSEPDSEIKKKLTRLRTKLFIRRLLRAIGL